MLPSMVAGTCVGLAAPPGHCSTRDGTLPVATDDALPSTLYETTQLFGVPDPGEAEVHAAELPAFAVTVAL